MMDDETRAFISFYLATVDEAVHLLFDAFPDTALWEIRRKYRRQGVMRERLVHDGEGVATGRVTGTFSFHGGGCRFRVRHGLNVDVDFDHENTWRGFDAWRLWCFGKFNPRRVATPAVFSTTEICRAALRKMESENQLVKYGDLYFLPESGVPKS